jgi:hypothetical protein
LPVLFLAAFVFVLPLEFDLPLAGTPFSCASLMRWEDAELSTFGVQYCTAEGIVAPYGVAINIAVRFGAAKLGLVPGLP